MRPQRLPLGSVPLIGQQQRQQQSRSHLNPNIQQLAMRIYSELAIAHLEEMPETGIDADALHNAATYAVQAATCYFQAIGAIPKEQEKT